MTTKDDHGYREDWDMTTEEGSLCFASCIHAKLVGGEQNESDLTWLANYLRVNSSACLARAFLDQPEPEGPTDEELMALAVTVFDNPFSTDKDYARAVLARWGSALPAPQP